MAKTFFIHVWYHPAQDKAPSADVFEVLCRRERLSTLKKKFLNGRHCVVRLDEKIIPEKDLKKVRVRPGCKVEFIPSVGWFWVALWNAIVWFGTYVVWPMLLSFAFSYLGGKLFNQDYDEVDEEGESENYAWNPRTTKREGTPRPRPYGEGMAHGNVVSQWTDVDDSDNEIMYLINDYGEGPVAGLGANILYINDQPAGNFADVIVQERLGTMDQTVMTGFEKEKIEYTLNWALTKEDGALTFTTPNDFFDDLEFTIAFPNGLIKYHKDGSHTHATVDIKVQISERGLDSWSTVYEETISGEQRSAKYINVKLSEQDTWAPTIIRGTQYDLKFSRSTAIQDERRSTASYIKSIREVIDVGFTRPGRVLLGVKALATGALNTALDFKCIRQGRIVNVYDGTSWSLEYSNNRAWVVMDILTQPIISGTGETGDPYVVERYEGINPNNIDLAFFYEWAAWCDVIVFDGAGGTEERMVCNFLIDVRQDVFTVAYKLAQIGRARIYWEGTILTGWLDAEVNTGATDLVTWDNIIARSWENAWSSQSSMAGTINLYFRDRVLGYERTMCPYSDEDAGLFTNTISIEASGETRWSSIVRMGKFALDRNRLIRNVNKFQMHKDAMRHHLGDVIRLQAKTPNWGINYRVVSASDHTVVFDRVVDVAVGDLIYIRTFDEESAVNDVVVESYTVASMSGTSVTFDEELSPVPIKDNVAAASTSSGETKLRRIIEVSQLVNNLYDVTVETYTPDLFSDEADFDPADPNPNYVWPAPSKRSGMEDRPITWRNIADLINRQLPPQPDIDIPWISNCDWSVNSPGEIVYWDARTADDPITFRYRGVTYEITAGSSSHEYIYWSDEYTDRFLSTDDLNTAIAPGNWVVAILKDDEVHVCSTPMQLLHAGLILAGTIRAESYAQLRQTMAWTGEDSLDDIYPYTFNFKLPSETTDLISAKLSFKIKEFRAYAKAAANDAGMTTSTVGGGPGTTGTGNSTTTAYDGGGTSGNSSGNTGEGKSNQTGSADCTGGYHYHTITASHSHSLNSHSHSTPTHSHSITATHTHSVTTPNHYHTTDPHNHGLTYGIYEESNAVNVDFHIDDGSGFGTQIGSYSGDQLDIDISSYLTVGAAWKAIRFDTDDRCRLVVLLEVKVDITA